MDRISSLPDEVLSHILSFLPTKYAVGTSILSPRWKNLWASVPVLDFNNRHYLNPKRTRSLDYMDEEEAMRFISFLEKVISRNRSPNLVKFCLHFFDARGKYFSRVNEWIQTVITRDVVELDVRIDSNCCIDDKVYLRLSPCQSLQVVKIRSNFGLYMPTSGCFPNLRILDVGIRVYETDEELTEKLFPSLPRLEKLCFTVDFYKFEQRQFYLNISGTALKSLTLNLDSETGGDFYNEVVIDARHLEYFELCAGFLASFLVRNKPPICEVNLDVGYKEEEDCIYDGEHDQATYFQLLDGVCNAKSLSISANTMWALLFARDKSLPMFHSLTKLELILYPSGGNLLLHWLQSSPNLKVLVLTKLEYEGDIDLQRYVNWSQPESTPTCLLLHLKEIEIRRPGKEDKVLKYIRENAKVLEKITLGSRKYVVKNGVFPGKFLLH